MRKQEKVNRIFTVLIVVQYIFGVWLSIMSSIMMSKAQYRSNISGWLVWISFVILTFAVHYFLIFFKFKRCSVENWCSECLKISSSVILAIMLYLFFPRFDVFFSPYCIRILVSYIPYGIILLLIGTEIYIHSRKARKKKN